MKEHPILFSAPMVRAILDGRKIVTRRVVKHPHLEYADRFAYNSERGLWELGETHQGPVARVGWLKCPYGVPGDRLWVRETWRTEERAADMVDGVRFAADGGFVPIANTAEAANDWVVAHENGKHAEKWRPSIFMRRWACRTLLEVVSVRVEPLRDVTHMESALEGAGVESLPLLYVGGCTPRDAFRKLWDGINGKRPGCAWTDDPWVWRIQFQRVPS